jgi:hypothetical protein
MTRRKAIEQCETKIGNYEVTPQAVWPIAISHLKGGGPRASTVILGPLGLKCHLLEKANKVADCVQNHFMPHDLCDETHEEWVEVRAESVLETVDNPPEKN